jgi:hypothetical protein
MNSRTRPIRRIRATTLQPVLSFVARRNARARELAAAMRTLSCAACGARLSAHVSPGNRWKGCGR